MSKYLSAIALAASVISAPAFAAVGLEGNSTAGYSISAGNGSFAATTSESVSFTTSDYGFDYAGTIIPAVGDYFGVLHSETASVDPTEVTYTFAAPTASTTDVLFLRLVTPDADADGGFDDFLKIELFGSAGAYFSQTYTASELNTLTGFFPDTGWITFQVAEGTTSFKLTVGNAGDEANDPTAYVDYLATPAVPEPMSAGLALAGLAVVGAVARRRAAARA